MARRTRWAAWALWAGALWACDDGAGVSGGDDAGRRPAECATHGECPAGLRCDEGVCVAPFDPPVETDAGAGCVGEPCPPVPWDADPRSDVDQGPPEGDAAVDFDQGPPEDDAALELDMEVPEDDAATGPDAFVEPPVPPVGVYTYERLPVGGLAEAQAVAFHPDGSYAVVLERYDVVHVLDWATLTTRRFDLGPVRGNLYWEDLAFDPDGRRAVLVGRALLDGASAGVVYHLDDAALRDETAAPFAETVRLDGEEFAAIARPADPAGRPVVLARSGPRKDIAILREYDPEAGRFDGLVAARGVGIGCNDVDFAANEFGGPGLLVVCGINGAQVLYYTEIAGIGEWRVNPGTNNLGNMARVAAHPSGDYALFISWSGRRVRKFEAGLIDPENPWFNTRGIWGVTFQQDGRRALVYGQAGGNPRTGTVIEYRHGACEGLGCALTEVHIPGFGAAPYNASGNTHLNGAAFRPGCDGGLIVGGESSWQGSHGQVVRFQIENGRPCR